jgi:hypothetical protein
MSNKTNPLGVITLFSVFILFCYSATIVLGYLWDKEQAFRDGLLQDDVKAYKTFQDTQARDAERAEAEAQERAREAAEDTNLLDNHCY